MKQKAIAAGILPICPKTKRVLLCRRGPNGDNPNSWASFGGGFEEGADENPKDAARREFLEESGYAGEYKLSNTPVYVRDDNHLIYYNYLGVVDEEFIPNLQKDELADYGWFHLKEMPENLHPGFKKMIDEKSDMIWEVLTRY